MKKVLTIIISLLMICTFTISDTKAIKSNGTLKNDQWFIRKNVKKGNVSYYKIVMKKAGGIILGYSKEFAKGSYTYRILNSKGKSLYSKDLVLEDADNITKTIGLNKGTYYVKVTAKQVTHKEYAIMYYQTNTTTIKGNTKASKAIRLTKGSSFSGVIPAGSKKKYYYKMTLSKKQAVKLSVVMRAAHGGGKGGLSVKIIPPKKTKMTGGYISGTGNQNISWSSAGSMAKGTYTIVVTQYSTGNGYYSIKWI